MLGLYCIFVAPTHSKESAVFSEIIEYQKVLKGLRAILGGSLIFCYQTHLQFKVYGLGFRKSGAGPFNIFHNLTTSCSGSFNIFRIN
jgi:hypothetical protein